MHLFGVTFGHEKACEKMEKYGTVIAPILILSGKLKQN